MKSVFVNKLRTSLSLLGITIGIFAIISVFTIVDSLKMNIRESLSTMGSNVIYIEKWPWTSEEGSGLSLVEICEQTCPKFQGVRGN